MNFLGDKERAEDCEKIHITINIYLDEIHMGMVEKSPRERKCGLIEDEEHITFIMDSFSYDSHHPFLDGR